MLWNHLIDKCLLFIITFYCTVVVGVLEEPRSQEEEPRSQEGVLEEPRSQEGVLEEPRSQEEAQVANRQAALGGE